MYSQRGPLRKFCKVWAVFMGHPECIFFSFFKLNLLQCYVVFCINRTFRTSYNYTFCTSEYSKSTNRTFRVLVGNTFHDSNYIYCSNSFITQLFKVKNKQEAATEYGLITSTVGVLLTKNVINLAFSIE